MATHTNNHPRRGTPRERGRIPREGTYLREIYDLLWNARPQPVKLPDPPRGSAAQRARDLAHQYELVIKMERVGYYALIGDVSTGTIEYYDLAHRRAPAE